MQQSEYLSVFFVCKKPQTIDDHEYRNGNNSHYFEYNNGCDESIQSIHNEEQQRGSEGAAADDQEN